MREKIMETLFEAWSDGTYELNRFEPDFDMVFGLIRKQVGDECNGLVKIENEVCNLISNCERNAFMNGVYLCLELLNGEILKQ